MLIARFRNSLHIIILLLLGFALLPPELVRADPTFANDSIRIKWQRADKPVIDGASNPPRSWLWGPETFQPNSASTEPYAESSGGLRLVQYFDKARMELTNPSNGEVTNGLLVRELISGRLAIGDTAFIQRVPANDIPVAGDPDGNDGPTYFSFNKIASLNNDNPATDQTGSPVVDTIDKTGKTGASSELDSNIKYAFFEQTLKHNIPDVFWNFMNARGNVYFNTQLLENQTVLGENPNAPWLDATGFPLTEAYWANITVSRQTQKVLIQAFERRLLTYNPANLPAFQVEMGNVGRHYFSWRYNPKYDVPASTPLKAAPSTRPSQPSTTPVPPSYSCTNLPPNLNGAFPFLNCGPAGMVIVISAPMQAGEVVSIAMVGPNDIQASYTAITRTDGLVIYGLTSYPNSLQGLYRFRFIGQSSGKEAAAFFWLNPPVSNRTVLAYPNPARINQDITLVLVGFKPNEPVTMQIKAPDPNAPEVRMDNQNTSEGGGITSLMNIKNLYPLQYQKPGDWTITVIASNDPNHTLSVNLKVV